jgi:hypothetical protein
MQATAMDRRGFLGRLGAVVGGLALIGAGAQPAEARSRRRWGWGGQAWGGSRRRYGGGAYPGYNYGYQPQYYGAPMYYNRGFGGVRYRRQFYGAPRTYPGAPVYVPMSGRTTSRTDVLRLLET